MRSDYWNVTDEQFIEETGKPVAHWTEVLDGFGASKKKSNYVVLFLQNDYGVPRYWARTLATSYLKREP